MASTFLAYNVASRAMEASQASINIVGNNISNVNTEGYTRQRVDIVSVTTSGMVQKYATPVISTGIGAKAVGTTQLRDPYIDARYRAQNAETNRYDTMVKGLRNLEDVFDEASAQALQGEFSSFINDLQSFSQTTNSSDIAQVVRSAAEKVTQMMNMYANQLDEIRVEQTENLEVAVKSEFNTYVKNIASLNKQIQKEEIYGNTPNELYDHRNLLIDKLSSLANIEVTTAPADVISENLSIPHYTIKIKNTTPGGEDFVIVDNEKYGEMSMEIETDLLNVQTVKLKMIDATGNERTTGVNGSITDGSLRGYLNIINGKGSFADTAAGESDSKGIYYYARKTDILANQFAKEFNKINSEIWINDDPNDGKFNDPVNPDYQHLNLFTNGSGLDDADITAKNIRISSAWMSNPSYINATRFPTLEKPPADYKPTPADADNVLRMISIMTSKLDFDDGSGNIIQTGTFNEYVTSTVSEVATDVELYTNFSRTATNVFNTISDARDSVAGVSLNEEGVNLSAFQKVYNAAMRYFNVLDENLDNVINKMGV